MDTSGKENSEEDQRARLSERLDAFQAGDTRFGLFLEGMASPHTLAAEPRQRRVVAFINAQLDTIGVELRDVGYPVFGSFQLPMP
ncbi:hypothetical protein GT755_29755 [Herbidospora sp. NEAU-GS84]|uniref:AbiJ-NTD3 domain-containing protein n=1 Tax=Herbidospora solisilvae TaxID=2696284 RepID=A0A7C9NI77_9ACTN|nr:hypothetical protein [Herbidospora solisilvae]NAS25855.1 hypothetical protein [Herbidospora solisilvae]